MRNKFDCDHGDELCAYLLLSDVQNEYIISVRLIGEFGGGGIVGGGKYIL